MALSEALELVKKIHTANRTNPHDREAAAKEMGYNGLSGRSAKVLSDLSHFGLLEKAGSGMVRVSRRAVEILYPESASSRLEAMQEAAASPTLFEEISANFPDGPPSENALRAYLMRNSFSSPAIPPIINSYLSTYRELEQEKITAGYGRAAKTDEESAGSHEDTPSAARQTEVARPSPTIVATPATGGQRREVPLMEGERVIFVEEAGTGQYLKLVATGSLDDSLLEALEDFTKRQRKRLANVRKDDPIAEAETDDDSGGQVQ